MKTHPSLSMLTPLAALLFGCATSPEDPNTGGGGGGGGANPTARPLTCDVIAGQNCWRTSVAQVMTCAPGKAAQGKLSSDDRTCAYPSGQTVAFDGDPRAIGADTSFGFELTNPDHTLCAGFSIARGHDDVRTVRSALGAASWTYGAYVTLACPDGSIYQADALSALRCHALPSALGFEWASGATGFQFGFLDNQSNVVDVIQCGS